MHELKITNAWQAGDEDSDEGHATLDADLEAINEMERRERDLDYASSDCD
ncbi:MAG: hypothetical protein ABSB73_10225 [Solirubrobacteraceae bacterium]